MGNVESISIDGCRLWFHSSDHLPPHFHCKKVSEWEIRVYFLTCSEKGGLDYDIKWGKEPDGKLKRTLNEMVVKHRQELLLEWEEKVIID
jgi:hypothetical protein